MRARGIAMLTTMLLGCGDAGSAPLQPRDEPASLERMESGTEESVTAETTNDDRPVRGFFATGFPAGVSEPIGTGFTPIQKLRLPAGKYIANGSAVLASNEAERRFIGCIFLIKGRTQGDMAKGMIGGTGRDDFASLPLTIGFSINAPTDLVLTCTSDVAGVVVSQTSHIAAIRVDRLTIQQP